MGLGPYILSDLLELKRAGAVGDNARVVEIGSQQLSDAFLQSDALLNEVYAAFGRARPHLGNPVGFENFTDQAPPSRPFWLSIGFDYAAIDYNGHRDSTALDLNRDNVPEPMRGAFDLVVNAGTTEHIANQDQTFRVIHDLCRKGGIMYHEVPAGGVFNHGFFNYHPRFFHSLAAFNLYGMLALRMSPGSTFAIREAVASMDIEFLGAGVLVEQVQDFAIRAIFRRQTNKPFASPLDVPPQTLPLAQRQPWLGLRHAIARRLV